MIVSNDSTPMIDNNPPGMLDQGSQKEDNCCINTFCWIFQILTWAGLVFMIFTFISKEDWQTSGYGSFGFCYFVYLILEFCSPTSRYLCNKSSSAGIYEKMGDNFRRPPIIEFKCECYHFETQHHTRKTSDGKTEHYTTQRKVVTATGHETVPYYSARDVSGLFLLNCDKAILHRKNYIKLELEEEINFADAISYMDYEYQKEMFWRKYRFRDVHFDFHENRFIPGLVHHNLIKMTLNEPFSVNFCFFFIFTIITFSEFYKCWVDSFCVYQRFKIRKIVSTRYDLNAPIYIQKYAPLVPQLNLIEQQFTYQPTDYNYINKENTQHDLPTEEELERAKQYESKIPNYQVDSNGGEVVDNPGYSSYGNNEPPAAFSSLGGNVALDPSQIKNVSGDDKINVISTDDKNEQGYTSNSGGIYNNN